VWSKNRDVPVADHVRAILRSIDARLPEKVPGDVFEGLVDAYARPALLVPPEIDPGARPALEALAGRDIALGLVSNTMRTPGAVIRQLLERHDLLRLFRRTTFSDEVGVRKPDPEIFALTLRALSCDAAGAVHVGDDGLLDVRGARAAGMRAIQVTTAAPPPPGPTSPDAVIRALAELPAAVAALG
jgi:putative hydrolase of the HAD superfamily